MSEGDGSGISREVLLRMVTDIVASYVRSTKVATAQLPDLIVEVSRSFDRPKEQPAEPAVSVRRSVTPEYLICLEDGKKLKMLKRYLMTVYGMTPEQYRAKWNLPKDYPMVAPNYARRRSELAKASGLGRRQERSAAATSAAPKRRRGRPPKSAA